MKVTTLGCYQIHLPSALTTEGRSKSLKLTSTCTLFTAESMNLDMIRKWSRHGSSLHFQLSNHQAALLHHVLYLRQLAPERFSFWNDCLGNRFIVTTQHLQTPVVFREVLFISSFFLLICEINSQIKNIANIFVSYNAECLSTKLMRNKNSRNNSKNGKSRKK